MHNVSYKTQKNQHYMTSNRFMFVTPPAFLLKFLKLGIKYISKAGPLSYYVLNPEKRGNWV